jgi:hypothetical protein
MRALSMVLTLAFGVMLAPQAEAGSRITCQCSTGKKSWIVGTNACQYHFNMPVRVTTSGGTKPAKRCNSRQVTAFKKMLCSQECSKS